MGDGASEACSDAGREGPMVYPGVGVERHGIDGREEFMHAETSDCEVIMR